MNLNKLKQVTPFSKALAATLFILLPFLGVFIGYIYAPEKVIVLENGAVKNIEVLDEDMSEDVDASNASVGANSDTNQLLETTKAQHLINSQLGNKLIFTRDHTNSYLFENLVKEKVHPRNPYDPFTMFVTKLDDRYSLVDASYNPAGMTNHLLVDEIAGVVVGEITEFDIDYSDQNIFKNPNLLVLVEDSQGKKVVQLIIDNAASEIKQSVYLQDFVTSDKILLYEEPYSNGLSLGVCEYGCFISTESLLIEKNAFKIPRHLLEGDVKAMPYNTYALHDEIEVLLPESYKLVGIVDSLSCSRSAGICVSE